VGGGPPEMNRHHRDKTYVPVVEGADNGRAASSLMTAYHYADIM